MKFVKINAVWCPACIITNKTWNKIKKEYQDIEIISLDYDFDSEEVEKYDVGKVLPVVIALDENNQEKERLIGEKKEKEIYDFLERNR